MTSPDEDAKSIPALYAQLSSIKGNFSFLSTGSLTTIAKMFDPAYGVPASFWASVTEVVQMGGAVQARRGLAGCPSPLMSCFFVS